MVRSICFVSAALAALSGTAWAQSALPYWPGIAIVDSITTACNNGGFVRTKDILVSSYRAKTGIAGEPNSPGIMFQTTLSEQAFFRTGGANSNANTMDGAGTCGGYVIRGNVTTIPNPSQPQPFACTFSFNVEPAPITATTQTVTVDGFINNWRGIPNCKVTFRAAYRLNPP